MEPEAFLACLAADSAALTAAARAADPRVPVPACPGWDLRKLVVHIGLVQHSVARIAEARVTSGADVGQLPRAAQAPDGAEVADWYEDIAAGLMRALTPLASAPGTPLWNWSGANQTAAFYFRRMAQETAVHRHDAEGAGGTAGPIDRELAADGVDEFLEVMLPNLASAMPAGGLGGSLHLHATDGPGEWLIELSGGSLRATRGHAKADAAIRAPTSALDLFVWNRVPAGDLDVIGDQGVASRWAELIRL